MSYKIGINKRKNIIIVEVKVHEIKILQEKLYSVYTYIL